MRVLITGVSRENGLGFSVARAMAEKGFEVIITARDVIKAEALAAKLREEGYEVSTLALDVTDGVNVELCAEHIAATYGSLDVLINNAAAGYEFEHTATDIPLKEVEAAFQTNVIGAWRVCSAFLPLLHKSTQARIVNISSEAGSFTSDGGLNNPYTLGMLSAYSISKTALNAYTVKLAQSLQGTDILVNAVHPGFTATHEGLVEQGARPANESATGVVWAATLPDDGPTGGFFYDSKSIHW